MNMKFSSFRTRIIKHPLLYVTLLGTLFTLPSSAQQYTDDQEFEFANALIDIGFRDYAMKVINGLSARSGNKSLVTLFEVRNLIGGGKFDEAEDLLKTVDDSNAKYKMMMRLGDIHFNKGATKKTAKLYEEVFAKYDKVPEDTLEREFYLEAAYKFFKLMQLVNNDEGAILALDRVRLATTNQFILRKTSVDLANLKVDLAENLKGGKRDKFLKESRDICNDLCMVPDKFFGDAIGVLTRIELLDGNYDRALALINDYSPMCQDIEEQMKQVALKDGRDLEAVMASSPVAAIRFQKGRIYMELTEKAFKERNVPNVKKFLVSGYKEYLNTFNLYPSSEWGSMSAVKIFEVGDWAYNRLGVKLEPRGGRAAVLGLMLKSADSMYSRKKYAESIKAYQRIYDNFPAETPEVASSLKNFAYAYINGSANGTLEDEPLADWMPRVTASYLATRFAKFPESANAIYGIAGHYLNAGQQGVADEIFTYFSQGFPEDPRAASILFNQAEYARKSWEEERTPGAKEKAYRLYEEVATDRFKNTKSYLIALDRLATSYTEEKEHDKAREFLAKIVENSPEGFDKAVAEFKLTNCDYARADYNSCIGGLQKLLNDLDTREIFVNAVDRKNIDNLLENVLFWLGATCSKYSSTLDATRLANIRTNTLERIAAGEDRAAAREAAAKAMPASPSVTTLETKAVEFWDDQLLRFGKIRDNGTGKLAPKALEGQGRILMAKGDVDEALKSYQRIADRFPETPEAERVYFYLVREGLRLGLDDVVDKYVGGMISSPSTYSAAQLLQVGQLLNSEGKFKEGKAILAKASSHPDCQKDTPTSRSMYQRALKAQVVAANESGDYAGCAAAGEKLLEEFPKSPYKFEINRELAKAYRLQGMYKEAETAIRWVFAYYPTSAADPKFEKMKADYELALIYEGWAQTEDKWKNKAIASYYRLTQRQPPRPHEEETMAAALESGASFCASEQNFKMTLQIADTYLLWFPDKKGTKQYDGVLAYREAARERVSDDSLKTGSSLPESSDGGGSNAAPAEVESAPPAE